MKRSRTWFIDLKKLSLAKEDASIILSLMMAFNDISLANRGYIHYEQKTDPKLSDIRKGGRKYFANLQCGHLNEGIKIIAEMNKKEEIRDYISELSEECQNSYMRLAKCIKGGSDYKKFQKYVSKIRHKLIFHYDSDLIDKALMDRVKNVDEPPSKVTAGESLDVCRFSIADDLLETSLCRHIWKIPRNKDLFQEIEVILNFINGIVKDFLFFSREFLCNYTAKYSA